MKIGTQQAAKELHDLIENCDCETLAALYEYAFANVKECFVNSDDEDYLDYELYGE